MDFNRTLYDPDQRALVDGALELLEALSEMGAKLVLVSRKERGRSKALEELGIGGFFDEVHFVDKKNATFFSEVMERQDQEANYVIGDHLYSEIYAGNQSGAFTVHYKRGKFSGLEPRNSQDIPNVTITHLAEALEYIKT